MEIKIKKMISNDQINLREDFVLPFNLKPVGRFEDQVLYGSNELNMKFLRMISKTMQNPSFVILIKKLLFEKKLIIPAFTEKSMLGFLKWKIFQNENGIISKNQVGFYNKGNNKVYIVFSNLNNIFMNSSNDFISKLMIHELMHMCSDVATKSFYSIFQSEIYEFYRYYFEKVFELKRNEKVLKTLIENVIKNIIRIETGKTFMRTAIKQYHGLIMDMKKNSILDSDEFEKRVNRFFSILVHFINNQNNFNKFMQIRPQFNDILNPLYLSYRDNFGMKYTNTIAIQELVFPSEVIAVVSELGVLDSKIVQILKKIN